MQIYLILIPLTALAGVALSYLSIQCSLNQGAWSFIGLIIVNIIPIWALISRYSRNLVFDELLYLVILSGSTLMATTILSANQKFTPINWFGLIIIFIGLILIRIKWPIKITQIK